MKEFDNKLNGFKQFKTETSDDLFDLSSSTRGNQQTSNQVGGNKGTNMGGPGFAPSATSAQTPTMGHAPTGGRPTGYRSNDGPLKSVSDNVTNHARRGVQQNTGAGFNNQRSFAKEPGYGQKDMSHIESNKAQKTFGGPTNTPGSHITDLGYNKDKTKMSGRFQKPSQTLGKGLVTQELFGKTGEKN